MPQPCFIGWRCFPTVQTSIHDPRHPQSQTGADKMLAPIGLVWTNHPQPDQGTAPRSDLHMGTAFLVSPCYILTAYHVVFGYRFGLRKGAQEEAEQDVSATFSVGGKRSRAVPAKYGQFSMFTGRDWVLLRPRAGCGASVFGWGSQHRLGPVGSLSAPYSNREIAFGRWLSGG